MPDTKIPIANKINTWLSSTRMAVMLVVLFGGGFGVFAVKSDTLSKVVIEANSNTVRIDTVEKSIIRQEEQLKYIAKDQADMKATMDEIYKILLEGKPTR